MSTPVLAGVSAPLPTWPSGVVAPAPDVTVRRARQRMEVAAGYFHDAGDADGATRIRMACVGWPCSPLPSPPKTFQAPGPHLAAAVTARLCSLPAPIAVAFAVSGTAVGSPADSDVAHPKLTAFVAARRTPCRSRRAPGCANPPQRWPLASRCSRRRAGRRSSRRSRAAPRAQRVVSPRPQRGVRRPVRQAVRATSGDGGDAGQAPGPFPRQPAVGGRFIAQLAIRIIAPGGDLGLVSAGCARCLRNGRPVPRLVHRPGIVEIRSDHAECRRSSPEVHQVEHRWRCVRRGRGAPRSARSKARRRRQRAPAI